jgi:hypothetical protein
MTLPEPVRVASIDVARDGGSLAAAFAARDGGHFTLWLKLRPDRSTPRDWCYDAPLLERRVPHLYTDKLTGGQHGYETREDTPLSWDDGAALLDRLAPLPVEQPHERHGEFLAEMHRIVAARGVLPKILDAD